jgi:aspartate ammonia-lyase
VNTQATNDATPTEIQLAKSRGEVQQLKNENEMLKRELQKALATRLENPEFQQI